MEIVDLIKIGLIMLTGLILLYLYNRHSNRKNNINVESDEQTNENFYARGDDNENEYESFFTGDDDENTHTEHFKDSKDNEYNVQPSLTNGFNYENIGNDDENLVGNQNPGDCFPKDQLTPDELLPGDVNSKWAQVNPAGQGELGDQNFLNAGFHVGVNTVGQTLRNANLQLRSEPPNPQVKVSPWIQSTIEPDSNRKPMEIGGCN